MSGCLRLPPPSLARRAAARDRELAAARPGPREGNAPDGAMAHARLTGIELDGRLDDEPRIAAINGASDGLLSVTVCGPVERVEAWVEAGAALSAGRSRRPSPHA